MRVQRGTIRGVEAGRRAAALAVTAILAAGCGGGSWVGGGGGTDGGPDGGSDPGPSQLGGFSIDVSVARLDLTAEQGANRYPGAVVGVTFRGDGVVVGYPPGASTPSWLTTSVRSSDATSVSYWVGISTTYLTPGDYATTLRFVSGKADGSVVVTKDLPVHYRVTRGLGATPGPLAFRAHEGVAPEDQAITLTSDTLPMGWQVSAQTASGGAVEWLTFPASSGTLDAASASVTVRALPRLAGTYTAYVVVKNAAGATRATLPVTYVVDPAAKLTGTLAARVTEAARMGDLDVPLAVETQLVAAAGAACRWTASADQPWASVVPAAGDLAATTPVAARLDPAGLWALSNGTRTIKVTVQFEGGCATALTASLSVQLALAPALASAASATWPVGVGTTSAELTRTIAVSSNLGEAFASHGGWQVTSSVPWLSATKITDGASAGKAFVMELQAAALATLPSDANAATVAVVPDDARIVAASVPVTLDLALPTVLHVAPYLGWVNRASEVIVRGSGFRGHATLPLLVGSQTVTGTVTGDTEIRATVPAVGSPARLPVTIPNALGLDRGASELVVVAEPGYAALALPLAKAFTRIALDAERQAVLLSGTTTGEILRVRFANGAWTTSSYALPDADGVAVTVDGKELLVSSGGVGTAELFVRLDATTLAQRGSVAYADFYSVFDLVAPLNDGRTLLVDSDQWADTIWYPSLAKGPYLDVHGASILLTRDRSRLIARETMSSNGVLTLDATDSTFRSHAVPMSYSDHTWSVSQDGGRVVDALRVFDRDFQFLGALVSPDTDVWSSAIAPDGRYHYAIARGATSWVIRRTDVSGAGGPYDADAATIAIQLPLEQTPRMSAVSEDGSTLFVLADATKGVYPPVTSYFFYAVPIR